MALPVKIYYCPRLDDCCREEERVSFVLRARARRLHTRAMEKMGDKVVRAVGASTIVSYVFLRLGLAQLMCEYQDYSCAADLKA